jgi:hypothetical protein
LTLDEEPEQRFGWLLGERARVVLINVPLVLILASAEYTSWLFQERPGQPVPANGFVHLMDHKGIKIYATPGEAWTSQWLSNLGWIAMVISLSMFLLRNLLKPGTPVIRPPVEGVPYPAEFIATLVGLASIAFGVFTRNF